jgi:hypothetical protein
MANEQNHVELGANCADICRVLDRGMSRKRLEDLSQPARDAINQLTTAVIPWFSSVNSSATHLVVELSRRFSGRTPNGVETIAFPDLFMRGVIRIGCIVIGREGVVKMRQCGDGPRVTGHRAREEGVSVVNEVGDDQFHEFLWEPGYWGRM